MKKLLFVVLLLLSFAFSLDAFETRLMIGGGGNFIFYEPMLILELTISTSSLSNKFQQEIGIRGETLLFAGSFHLVLRSWFLFPNASSQFMRERLRLGIEYSPFGYVYDVIWGGPPRFPGILTAICTSIVTKSKRNTVREIYLSVGITNDWSFTWWQPSFTFGIAWRWGV